MNNTPEKIARALETLEIDQNELDDLVYDAANDLASKVNNEGLVEQVKFLQLGGYKISDIFGKISTTPTTRVKHFDNTGETFSALWQAEEYLKKHGYSYGPLSFPEPVAVMKGDWTIAKWKNLTIAEREQIDGKMTGDFREGTVTLQLYR